VHAAQCDRETIRYRSLGDSATDPPSFYYGATSAVALQSRIAHNLCVSEFQFGGLPAVALAKAGDSFMLFV
jgi:hypothetical protein